LSLEAHVTVEPEATGAAKFLGGIVNENSDSHLTGAHMLRELVMPAGSRFAPARATLKLKSWWAHHLKFHSSLCFRWSLWLAAAGRCAC